MLRRSQATFMNAYTGMPATAHANILSVASDWTMYPFSTMNNVDFKNLLSVYADAAFFPKLTKMDFM